MKIIRVKTHKLWNTGVAGCNEISGIVMILVLILATVSKDWTLESISTLLIGSSEANPESKRCVSGRLRRLLPHCEPAKNASYREANNSSSCIVKYYPGMLMRPTGSRKSTGSPVVRRTNTVFLHQVVWWQRLWWHCRQRQCWWWSQ